jgi:hypothetical protein
LASIFCANTSDVDPGEPAVAHRSEIVVDVLDSKRAEVVSVIAGRCTCSKFTAKSLLQVEMLVRPDGRAGLPQESFANRPSRCFCCFYRKLSATDIVSAAEILEFKPHGAQKKRVTGRLTL